MLKRTNCNRAYRIMPLLFLICLLALNPLTSRADWPECQRLLLRALTLTRYPKGSIVVTPKKEHIDEALWERSHNPDRFNTEWGSWEAFDANGSRLAHKSFTSDNIDRISGEATTQAFLELHRALHEKGISLKDVKWIVHRHTHVYYSNEEWEHPGTESFSQQDIVLAEHWRKRFLNNPGVLDHVNLEFQVLSERKSGRGFKKHAFVLPGALEPRDARVVRPL